jgi:OOP family OmpA-OmpF porin
MRIRSAALISLLMIYLSGCAAMQKPWGSCAIGGAVIGGAALGIAGGVMANTEVFGDDPDDGTRAAAIGAGVASGALLGALAGHLLCDGEAPAPVVAEPPPPAPPAPLEVLTGNHFAFNSATLTPGAIAELSDTLSSLQNDPELRIRIDGHTDSVGSDAYNLRLSERRADSVKRYLVSEGISATRIETRGFGESSPVADNDTEEGRARNRRVEVHRAP